MVGRTKHLGLHSFLEVSFFFFFGSFMAHWWVVVMMGYYLLMFSLAFLFPGFRPFFLVAIFHNRI
jgi:hypothetical protein